MKGIILAGGEGKRLRPLTLTTPKPLVLIKDKPLINFNLDLFQKYDITEVKVIIRPADMPQYQTWLARYAPGYPGMHIDIAKEDEPMGTLGYVFHHLRGWAKNEDVFITNGDDIKNIDLHAMRDFHRTAGHAASLALMHMEEPADYGAVLVREGKIVSFVEKNKDLPPGLVSAGMYLLSPAAMGFTEKAVAKDQHFLMFEKDMFPVLAKAAQLGGFVCQGTFFDCGTPERLERAIREA